MTNTVIVTQPDQLSPINDIYRNTFIMGNSQSSATNFKYLTKLYANGEYLVKEGVPPRPITGQGWYSGYIPLLANVSYDRNQTIFTMSYATNSIVEYYINAGLSYNPELTISPPVYQLLIGTTSFFGFSFSTPHGILPGDLITIQSENPFFAGTSSIRSYTASSWNATYSIVTDRVFTTASNVGTGVITDLQRFSATSSLRYGFNGTRQYSQGSLNFGLYYNIGGTTVLDNRFLTSYPPHPTILYKQIKLSQWETISGFVASSAFPGGQIRGSIRTYDVNNTLLSTFGLTSSIGSTHSIYRMDFPVGTKNLATLGISFTNVDHYDFRILNALGTVVSNTRSWQINSECSIYTNVRIMFLNEFGAFEYWNFTQDDKKTYTISRNEYKQQLGWNYRIGDSERTILAQKIEEKHTINTNWISEYDYGWLSNLVKSPVAYVIDESNGNAYPIIITDTDFTFKSSFREKIFNMELSFVYSFQIESQRM